MNFIEELNRQIVSKYENYYVSYKQLNDAIIILKERENVADTTSSFLKGILLPKDFTFGDTTAIHGMVEQRPEVRFISLLEHELSKINHFTSLELKTILSSLRQISKRLNRVLKGDDSTRTPKPTAFPSSSATDEITEATSLQAQLASFHSRLVNISDELLTLEHYVQINVVIFQKIAQEFDSQFSDRPPISNWFIPKLIDEPFRNIAFSGLFTVIGSLFNSCITSKPYPSAAESLFVIPAGQALRTKLLFSSLVPLSIPSPAPVPIRSEELSNMRGAYSSASELIHLSILSDRCSIKSISFSPSTHMAEYQLANSSAERHSIPISELEDRLQAVLRGSTMCSIKVIQFDRTGFGTWWVGENVKVCLIESVDILKFVHEINTTSFLRSMDWTSLEGALVNVAESAIASNPNLAELFGPSVVKLGDLKVVEVYMKPARPVGEPRTMMQIPDRTPEQVFSLPPSAPTPLLSASVPAVEASGLSQLEQTAGKAVTMIYPKNYMANERALLAWISAISIQTGIGLSLLNKPGLSFIGSVMCLIALTFLWWSVAVFVRRFRHIQHAPRDGDQSVFFSMRLPTTFGFVQIIVLVVQSLIVLFS